MAKRSAKPNGSRTRDRIVDLVRVRAGDLLVNPRNWRTHPEAQQQALRAILDELGYINGLVARRLKGKAKGQLELIDGHLRAKLDPEEIVPVLVVDLDDAETAKALATFDPIGAMATADAGKLDALLRDVQTGSEALAAMLTDLAKKAGLYQEDGVPDGIYTNKIISPVYEPKGECPAVSALFDRQKTEQLLAGIDSAELPDEVAAFLRLAAERHTVFNFRQIAEYYCHASPDVQDLMERSGLVIIDFNKAIENGFVHLTERLGELSDLEGTDIDA